MDVLPLTITGLDLYLLKKGEVVRNIILLYFDYGLYFYVLIPLHIEILCLA